MKSQIDSGTGSARKNLTLRRRRPIQKGTAARRTGSLTNPSTARKTSSEELKRSVLGTGAVLRDVAARELKERGAETDDVYRERVRRLARQRQALGKQSMLSEGRAAFRLAREHRQAIREGDLSPFVPAFAFALLKDFMLDFVPIIGNLFGFFISVYLFIFLFGRGKTKVRIAIFALSFLEVIPAVNFVPFQTLCVAYAYLQAKKSAKKRAQD